MTILPMLRDYKDKLGKRQVLIKVTDGKKRTFYRTPVKITEADWDENNLRVKHTHPNYRHFNTIISKKILEVETGVMDSPETKNIDFIQYVQDCISQWEKTKASETIRQHWSELNKIKAMPPKYLHSLNLSWLNKYSQHLYSIGNSTNTVWKSMKFIKTVIHKAFKEQLIEKNPFDLFDSPKYKDPEKIFLTVDQVEAIDTICSKDYPPELIITGTWFVIGCYTGLRFTDMVNFSKKNIRAGRLVVTTHKTKEVISMPVNDRLKALFERVDYKGLPYTNVHANRLLKQVIELAEIDEDISFHCSRHTFATMCAESGISQEVTAKILGHKSLKTTSIYYKISNNRIDQELDKLL